MYSSCFRGQLRTKVRASAETVKAALIGNYQPEHLFALKQAIELHDFYQTHVDDCDVEIEHVLTSLKLDKKELIDALPAPRHKTRQPNAVNFDTRPLLHQITRIDLTQIHGIWTLPGAASNLGVRYRSQSLANRQALHLVVNATAGVKD